MSKTWQQRWRPAGGWPLYAIVLVAAMVIGSGSAYAYYQASKPPAVHVIIPSPLTATATVRAPTPHASTRFVTEPPVTVQPSHPLPAAQPQGTPSPSLTPHRVHPSGSANIPGISGWVPPATTGGEPSPPPATDNPTPGVTAPSASPTSPSQGGF